MANKQTTLRPKTATKKRAKPTVDIEDSPNSLVDWVVAGSDDDGTLGDLITDMEEGLDFLHALAAEEGDEILNGQLVSVQVAHYRKRLAGQ